MLNLKTLHNFYSNLGMNVFFDNDGFAYRFFRNNLDPALFREYRSLLIEAIRGEEVKPSPQLLQAIHRLYGRFEEELYQEQRILSLGAKAFFGASYFEPIPEFEPLIDYLLDHSMENGYLPAFLEKAEHSKEIAAKEYYLLQAMEKGSGNAAWKLAHIYKDVGNEIRYLELLQMGWSMGSLRAAHDYQCHLLDNTDPGDPDYRKNLERFTEFALKTHHAKSLSRVALVYGDSTSSYYDLDKAVELWEMSAYPENPESCYYLAVHYRQVAEKADSKEVHDAAIRKALEYANMGYQQGKQPMVGLQLGFILLEMKSYDDSYAVFEELSKRGNGKATRTLGLFYSQGLGREEDWAKALPLFQKAVEQGYGYAEFDIGLYYELSGSAETSMAHYKKALENGYLYTAKHLAKAFREGTPFGKNEKLAQELEERYAKSTQDPTPFWGK